MRARTDPCLRAALFRAFRPFAHFAIIGLAAIGLDRLKSGNSANDPIADMDSIGHLVQMKKSVAFIADDWIEFQRLGAGEAPDDVFDRGWALYDLIHDDPNLAWEVIKNVVGRYHNDDLSDDTTEGHHILGMIAAGPLEDLLAYHGPAFIVAVETEARQDARMSWTLGRVWQNAMSNEVWARVQRAAGLDTA